MNSFLNYFLCKKNKRRKNSLSFQAALRWTPLDEDIDEARYGQQRYFGNFFF
jgi:spore germination cell wall hydrolase CwlJ-like protein